MTTYYAVVRKEISGLYIQRNTRTEQLEIYEERTAAERNLVPKSCVEEVYVCSKKKQILGEEDTANLAEGIRVSDQRIEELERALRWACNLYMVADEWQGQERENRINKAMDYAIREGSTMTRRREP